ncbi:MAG: alanine--glyoxylate aminotransferase family protein [Planctomycetes bacterium]|nr:alanine--glyoxylate aminotransferase family protein [Planctomycetota bacterium]
MADHPVLFLPGPTEVDDELRQIMAMPLLGHREPRFVAVVQDVCRRLRDLYLTRQATAFETCAATALMEAGIRNLVPRGGRSLHLVCGAFSERWQKIAQLCGRDAEALTVPPGQAHPPALLRARLQQGPPVQAVVVTHNETATGVLEPLRELAATVHAHAPDALLLVDVVTSVGGAELRFDDWGLDFAFAGTQKCLALPPGLCTYAVSRRALARAATIEERGFLLDLPRAVADTDAGKTLATPCVPLVYALQRQLERVAAEGLPQRWARHLALRDATLAWAAARGMRPFVGDEAARSPTVSCIDARGGDVEALARRADAAGYRIDEGYGELKGRAFRIGHMGDHPLARLRALLAAL